MRKLRKNEFYITRTRKESIFVPGHFSDTVRIHRKGIKQSVICMCYQTFRLFTGIKLRADQTKIAKLSAKEA